MKPLDQAMMIIGCLSLFVVIGATAVLGTQSGGAQGCMVFGSEINGNNTVEFLGVGNC